MCIALGVYSVVVGLPFIFLWRTYKKAILRFVSAQDEVLVADSAAMRQHRIVALVLITLGFLVLGVAIFWLIRAKSLLQIG